MHQAPFKNYRTLGSKLGGFIYRTFEGLSCFGNKIKNSSCCMLLCNILIYKTQQIYNAKPLHAHSMSHQHKQGIDLLFMVIFINIMN